MNIDLEARVDAASLDELREFDPESMVQDLDQITESHGVTLTDLYARWERQNWSAFALDFTKDAQDWKDLGEEVTERMLWFLSMFFHGEEAVTATLAPWVSSAPNEEIRHFMSTQVADEARHAVFFHRFYELVVGAPGGDRARLQWSEPRINDAFNRFFWELLPEIAEEVQSNPGDPVVYARGVAFYHLIVEGTLAVPGQKFLLAYCRNRDVLPAFRAGFTAVARDESRHVGAGVRILEQLVASEPACREAVQDLIKQVLPDAAEIFIPPNLDFTYPQMLGYDMAELFRFATQSVEKRMRAAGVPVPRIRYRLPQVKGDPILPYREPTPAEAALRAVRADLTPAFTFEGLALAFNPKAAEDIDELFLLDITGKGGGTWTIKIAGGAVEVFEGAPSEEPTTIMEMDAETWLALSTGEMLGAEAFLLGRLTFEGVLGGAGARFSEYFRP